MILKSRESNLSQTHITLKSVVFLSIVSLLPIVGSCAARSSTLNSTSTGLPKFEKRDEFANYNRSVVCKTGAYVVANDETEVVSVVKYAATNNQTLRVVSHEVPHSYSPSLCPLEGGIVLNVAALTIPPLNKTINVDASSMTAVVAPGVLISELQEQLHTQNLAFPVTPDYNRVTVAGAMGTGAHHSSLKIQSSVADWVEEIRLVDGKGDIKTLKGADLDLVRVHLGLVGVVTQLKLRLEPQSKLQMNIISRDDSKIGDELIDEVREHDYARVRWFPTNAKYVMDTYNKVSVSKEGESYDNAWEAVPDLKFLGDIPAIILNQSKFVNCSAEFIRANTFGGTIKNVKSEKGTVIGWSHKMMAGGCEVGKCPWDKGVKGRTVEVAIPVSKFKDWVADVRSVLKERQGCFPTNGLYLRFSKASEGALSQAYGEDMMAFEIHLAVETKPTLEKWSDVYDEIVQMSIKRYNGRPHWGKNSLPYFVDLGPTQFPKWSEFEAKRKELDPNGIFVSALWQGIQKKQEALKGGAAFDLSSPECGVRRDCICTIGSSNECGPKEKATCVEGGFFTEARVCREK